MSFFIITSHIILYGLYNTRDCLVDHHCPHFKKNWSCHLGPERGTAWVFMTNGPGSAPRHVYRGSEKGPLNPHLLNYPQRHTS